MSANHLTASCDRVASREARNILTTGLLPAVRQLGVEFAPSCPLHPDHDHLLRHERAKQPATQWQWRCGECGKIFKSEHYLDLHLERRHNDTLPAASDGTCLADYCDILRCPSWIGSLRHKAEHRSACRPAMLEARRALCQHVMHDCFVASAIGVDLHHVFERMDERYCHALSCAGRQRIRDGLEPSERTTALAADGSHTGYYAVAGLLFLALGVLYASLLVWFGDTRGDAVAEGLRARRGRQRRSRGGGWLPRLFRGDSAGCWED